MKQLYISLIILIASTIPLLAQVPDFVWAKQGVFPLTGNSNATATSIAVDNAGNSHVVGKFTGSITFGSYTLTSNPGIYDIFIVKYNPSGNALWAKSAGKGTTSAPSQPEVKSIALDASGNSYIVGDFIANMSFGSVVFTNSFKKDIFIAKYDAAGNFLWAKTIRRVVSTFQEPYTGNGIAVDGSGNCYVTGSFGGNAAFGSINLASVGTRDAFLAKYDPAGNVLWVKKSGGTGTNNNSYTDGNGIALDQNGNIFIAGRFMTNTSTVAFGSTTFTNSINDDAFIAKYDAAGNVLWANGIRGNQFQAAKSICVDILGNSYITGWFSGNATFGNNTLINYGTSWNDIFVAKYNNLGGFVWAEGIGGTLDDQGYGIDVDSAGNTFVTGAFRGNVTFGNTPLPGGGSFIAKFDSLGNITWAKKGGGTQGNGIAINGKKSFIAGEFNRIAVFANDTLKANYNGMFVAKLDFLPTGITESEKKAFIRLFPNPTSNIINLEILDKKQVQLRIYSNFGHMVFSSNLEQSLNKEHIQLDLSTLSKGIYMVQILMDKQVINQRLVLQ